MSTGEQIPIAVAEVVNSSKDTNVNQEIDEKIASVIAEIERKAAEIEAINQEARALKKSLEPLFGAAFIRRQIKSFPIIKTIHFFFVHSSSSCLLKALTCYFLLILFISLPYVTIFLSICCIELFSFWMIVFHRIEEDPVWSQVDSEQFDSKFLANDIPAVVNIATLVKRAHLLSVERTELEVRLGNLREDRRNNSYLPGELFRFIKQLQDKVEELESRLAEVEALKTKKAEELDSRALQFDLFSNPAQTSWNPATSTLTYLGPASSYHFASSSVPLPSDHSIEWKLEIIANNNWVMLGIIGKNEGIALNGSYSDATCYDWGTDNYVCVAGVHKPGQGGWAGWQQGDRGLFTYNPAARSLSLRLERTNTLYTIDNLPSAYTAYIYCNLFMANTAIRLSAAS